jgi:hypothetical protein
MKRYLNPNLPPKNLWRSLDEIGAKEVADNNIIFTLYLQHQDPKHHYKEANRKRNEQRVFDNKI